MKTVMKKRFVPSHYGRDLHQRLRRLSLGSKSVEDYHQKLETLIMKAGVIEDAEATMGRFQGGLNRDIQDRPELQEYEDMDELLHKAILIEQQNKRKRAPRTQYGTASKSTYSRDDKSSTKPKEKSLSMETRRDDKGKGPATATRSRNVKCFKCQDFGHYANECTNKKVMIVLANGDVVSEDEKTDQESDEEGVEYPVQGDLIIDGGSCTNVASEELVEKLGLEVYKHPKPYHLQWLNEEGGLKLATSYLGAHGSIVDMKRIKSLQEAIRTIQTSVSKWMEPLETCDKPKSHVELRRKEKGELSLSCSAESDMI
ncbi:hypothetical protein N665_0484s0006 [Sinapis alba]|nr:hypothetical protein N665_0484s0006 [Sinapis alba]